MGALHAWAVGLGGPRQWGIEGAWNYGRGLAQHLVDAGEAVYEVNPRWTAQGRRSARRPGKTDALDAQAVAALVLREAATLPRVGADDETAVLELLVTERDGAVAEATRLRNQLHQLLLQVDPEYRAHRPALRTPAGVAALAQYTTPSPRPLDEERAAAVRRLAQRLRWRWPRPRTWPGRFGSAPGRTSPLLTGVCGVSLDGRGTRGHPRAGPPVPHRCPTRRLRRRRPTGGLQRRAGARFRCG